MKPVLLFPLLLSLSCGLFNQNTIVGKTVDCASDAVRENWPAVLPRVNSCIVAATAGEAARCLESLIPLVKGGVDVVACVVRGSVRSFSDMNAANPNDERAARGAYNGDRWLSDNSIRFK